jgi:hypothetical protein
VTETTLKQYECPQCQTALNVIYLGENGEPVKVECNYCGAAFPVNISRVLTLNDADLLGGLIRGVQANAKLRYYQFGTRDTEHPLIVTMRAFTHDGGGFISETEDVRDAYVWCSGFMERWIKVSDIITALDNLQGSHGLENPIAVIDYPKE